MHIVIDCRFVRHTGIGRYIRELVSRIVQRREHRFTLIVSPREQDDKFLQAVVQPNVEILSCSATMYSLREQMELPWIIPKCDVFWAPHFNAPVLPIRAKRKIVTIHDMCHLAVPQGLSWIKKCYAHTFLYLASHLYDAVVTVSDFSKREIRRFENIPADKITVAYNAVDTTKYRRTETPMADRNHYTEKYNLPASYFLYIGGAKPHKNLEMLLEAYIRFKTANLKGPSLLFAGSVKGFRDAGLEACAQSFGLGSSICFPGYIREEDMPELYRGAVAFLFPSKYEGFGIPPLEAMACGCPVIASDAGAVVEVCEEAALYAPAGDPLGWTDRMKAVWQSPSLREEMKDKGYKQVKKYSWEASAEALLNVLTFKNKN